MLSACRQYVASRNSLLYRLCGPFCIVGLTCSLIVPAHTHASQVEATPADRAVSENRQQQPGSKDETAPKAKKDTSSTPIDPAKIREEIDALRTDNSLPEELRARCQEVLTTTLKDLESSTDDKQQIEQLIKAAQSSEQRKKAAESTGDNPVTIPLRGITKDSESIEIENLLRTLNKDLLSTTLEANRIQKELNARRTETKALPVQIAEAEEELASLVEPEEKPDTNPVLSTALKQAAIARRAKLETALTLFRQKIATYDAEASVLPLEKVALDKLFKNTLKATTKVSTTVPNI